MKKLEKYFCLMLISIPLLIIASAMLLFTGSKVDDEIDSRTLAFFEAMSKEKARQSVLAEIESEKKKADSLHSKEPVFSQKAIDLLIAKKADSIYAAAKKEMAHKKTKDFQKKERAEIISYVLSDKRLWLPILEEIEIRSAVQAGIDKYKTADSELKQVIFDSCLAHGYDPDLGFSVVAVESQFYRKAVSPKGAKGPWQNMPTSAEYTCKRFGVKFPKDRRRLDSLLFDPAFSTFLGLAHLRESRDAYGYSPAECLVAYEAGNKGVEWQVKNYGKAENVPYYRKVYGVLEGIKKMKGEEVLPDMPPAPEIVLGY